jgi:hypothetical protein
MGTPNSTDKKTEETQKIDISTRKPITVHGDGIVSIRVEDYLKVEPPGIDPTKIPERIWIEKINFAAGQIIPYRKYLPHFEIGADKNPLDPDVWDIVGFSTKERDEILTFKHHISYAGSTLENRRVLPVCFLGNSGVSSGEQVIEEPTIEHYLFLDQYVDDTWIILLRKVWVKSMQVTLLYRAIARHHVYEFAKMYGGGYGGFQIVKGMERLLQRAVEKMEYRIQNLKRARENISRSCARVEGW